ncbi:hypothetical protein C2845_PM06G18010 [Panicum miliaceum]|uniref:Uncharacterized protein n=1 Tax=Panicum miliaceum TaxID=4540 RepID=A0A3L6RAK0_PANMI|nr:hypothetical protein C2845_PM06G18010 [Panicum miliaceum]
MCNNSTGINRDPSGEVIANHHWWKTNLEGKQNKAELRKLIYGEPNYCPHLEIMLRMWLLMEPPPTYQERRMMSRKKKRRKKKKRMTNLILL